MACSGLGAISADQINGAAKALGIPCEVVRAQLNMESGGRLGLTSSAGAQGPWQFLPSTYGGLGCASGGINDPVASTACYIKYMTQLLKEEHGSIRNALAAYNAGPGNIGAGMGYADSILAAAKVPGSATSSGGSGSGSGGSGGGTQQAQTSSFDWSFGGIPGIGWIGHFITGTIGSFGSIGDVAKSIAGMVRTMNKLLELFALLFRPEFWLRVGAFLFGLLALGAGIYFLKDSLA